MSKMLKTHRNTIGNLMIALLFVGGCIFLLTGSWDASEPEAATGCCGGSEATLVAETTSGCCGGGENPPIETVTGGGVDVLLAQKGGVDSSSYTCDQEACKGYGDAGKQYANCPARASSGNCTGCSMVSTYCDSSCNHQHEPCRRKGCLHAPQRGGCSNAGGGPPCVPKCKGN